MSQDKNASMPELQFELLVDDLPYVVTAIPFEFNGGTRFRVSYNGGKENIFAWDSDLKRLRAIDDDASTMPDALGIAISKRLELENS